MTVAGQPAVSYTFDHADRLTQITQGTSTVAFAYDAADRRTSLTLPNGLVVEYAYDADSRLTGLTYRQGTTPIGTLTYSYDAAGRRAGVGGTWARTTLPAALASASYDAANQIVQFAGVGFTYDANGNLTSDGARTLTWNARNQLTGLAGPVSGSFGYDGFGRRRSKTIGGTTTNFLYDGLNPVQELAGGLPAATLVTGLDIDEYFTRTDAAGARHVLTDALGSTVALADAMGAVQTEYTYEAFGAFGAFTTSGAGTGNSFAFTGREADGTGLMYYRARYYDPQRQRFVSEDPVEFAAGDVNLYAYVGNQPTMWRDPSGLIKLFLPPGHPCAWPPEGSRPKSKSDEQPPPGPPFSWWLQCSPFVVPDLLPIPPVRPGKTGMPRFRGPRVDLKPHPFPIIGPQPHVQIDIWFDGIPGIRIPIRIPFPGWPWW